MLVHSFAALGWSGSMEQLKPSTLRTTGGSKEHCSRHLEKMVRSHSRTWRASSLLKRSPKSPLPTAACSLRRSRTPSTRPRPRAGSALLPRVRDHAAFLTTSFDMIDAEHRTSSAVLADWIVKNYQPGQHLDVTVVCTANSRRSLFGATMGNIAADYYGIPEIRFHSGGTAASAINARAVACLKAIGVEIEPTGKEAPRGEPQDEEPDFCGSMGKAARELPPAEANEFSKVYTDPANPQGGFAALVVCAEADTACPIVRGADVRISMPFLDAKMYDDGSYEAAKYAERRDDIGRFMLSVMLQAKVKLRSEPVELRRSASVGNNRLRSLLTSRFRRVTLKWGPNAMAADCTTVGSTDNACLPFPLQRMPPASHFSEFSRKPDIPAPACPLTLYWG